MIPAGTLLVSLAAQASPAVAGAPSEREPVAGLAGIRVVTRALYPTRPDLPHRNELVFVFPDRARVNRTLEGGSPTERDNEYRYGARAFVLEQGTGASRALEGDELDVALLRMELRRAVFLWPDGFAWKRGRSRARTCELRRPPGTGTGGDPGDGEELLGELVAELGGGGRPDSIRARDASGSEVERIEIESWLSARGRRWPARLRVVAGERTRLEEEVLLVETDPRFLDAFFLPPDRRDGATVAGARTARPLDIVPMTFRRIELPGQTTWEEALERFDELRDGEGTRLERAGFELDPNPTIEVQPTGAPASVLLRLARPADDPPKGFTSVGERPGVAILGIQDRGDLEPEQGGGALQALLRRAAPREARPTTPYVRAYGSPGSRRFHLILPFEPELPDDDG